MRVCYVLILICFIIQLFVIDGDFVHLREGAHAIISATTAVAKVAAAAAGPSSTGTNWPPAVALTPVGHAQNQRAQNVTIPLHMGSKLESSGAGGTWESSFYQQQTHQNFIGHDNMRESLASQYQQSTSAFANNTLKSDGHFLSTIASNIDKTSSSANRLDVSNESSVVSESDVIETSVVLQNRQVTR